MKNRVHFLLFIFWLCAGSLLAEESLKVRDLYSTGGSFSEKAKSFENKKIKMQGFMAPPLKPDAKFFVLTKMPMAVCPFCDNEADWPRDIVVVYLNTTLKAVNFNKLIEVKGTLKLGTFIDTDTGFVSRVRLTNASFWLK